MVSVSLNDFVATGVFGPVALGSMPARQSKPPSASRKLQVAHSARAGAQTSGNTAMWSLSSPSTSTKWT